MTTDQHITKVENDVIEIKAKMNGLEEKVDAILKLVEKMDAGLYGDRVNRHIGVIDRQAELEQAVTKINQEIAEIHKKNSDQDIEIRTKKSFKSELVEHGKELFKWGLNAFIIYLILKGVLGPDTLLKN